MRTGLALSPEQPNPAYAQSALLAVTVDAVNDTLVVLTMDEQNFHLSTYPRSSANLTAPIRRIDFEHGPLSGLDVASAIDAERERIFVATGPQLRTFPLMATGATEPLESLAANARGIAISPSRDEIHLLVPGAAQTLALGAPLQDPPLRSLNVYGALVADEVHGELWSGGSVYDIEATGPAEPLLSPPLSERLVAILGEGNEWLTQAPVTNMIVTYPRQPSSASLDEPLRVLAGGDGQGSMYTSRTFYLIDMAYDPIGLKSSSRCRTAEPFPPKTEVAKRTATSI